jgi:alpha-glucosidase
MAEWWRGAVIYQIYPRSFLDTNGDGVGDLAGVIAKLDYIAALGVDGIWLSPFYPSPMKDFGYDVSDYVGVDPLFGTLADFDALLAGAHARGLKVIIDQVWSHTSDKHSWFVESTSSRDNPKADWYVWADPKPDGTPPNNWLAVFGGASWTWSTTRRQYYLHNFLVEQPDLNLWRPEVRAAILDVARFWLDRGVDGFRLDVINFIVHDAELRDNPAAGLSATPAQVTQMQRHVFDRSRPEALGFIAELRADDRRRGGRQSAAAAPAGVCRAGAPAHRLRLPHADRPARDADPVRRGADLLGRCRRLAVLVAGQPRCRPVRLAPGRRRSAGHPDADGGAHLPARDDLPLSGRGAGPAAGKGAVRAAARPL